MISESKLNGILHGKGACDGLGGTVKRLAARASLQRPYYDQLMTPSQLFDWACTSIPAGIVAVKIMQGSSKKIELLYLSPTAHWKSGPTQPPQRF